MKEYFDLKEIIELNNISKELKNGIQAKFNKLVFYENNDCCKIGTLIGLKIDNEPFYIIMDKTKNYVPIWKSITKV